MFWAFHALTKARLGDLSELTQMEDRVRNILRASGLETGVHYYPLYFDAACLQAALAKRAFEARERVPSEQRRLAQRDLDRALELLDKALVNGEFKGDQSRRDSAGSDPRPVKRKDPRFQLLMMDLAFPGKSFRGKARIAMSPPRLASEPGSTRRPIASR